MVSPQCVRARMLSEIRVRKSRKLAFHHYALKCESNDYVKQDQVNNANSASIFMINLLIIQGCQSGSVGQGGQLVMVVSWSG